MRELELAGARLQAQLDAAQEGNARLQRQLEQVRTDQATAGERERGAASP